ncbi:nascent polypeptide-associated complex subunit alpha, muscle-specific form-like [Leopardus geoffroyi]|uniref:nascent polypeptide-associated complex subunit alpha, muscle-specific form-like n=1 Tax=Leopardus geoffroyi TaxID=46844 RepID=UPI001E264EA0|nr:nascent polypeptide-associated complex subunit alpha, muscle-specific form-like [Leopardus geoffroyi]XP_045357877.1 nascent polypeptide-associated complex subunit alpha, muscle-specific form-like [Leopardus geoffroyi]
MRLNTEEEAGCKRGGGANSCHPSPPIALFLSTVNICARCTAQNLLRCASGGGVRGGGGGEGRRGTLLPPMGGKGREGKGSKGAQDYPRALPRSHPERAGPERPALGPPFPGRRRASRGAAHTPAGAPRHESPTQEKGATHRSKPSPAAAAPPGATSRPPWGRRRRRRRCLEQPPKQSQAGSAATAVTSRTGRRRPSLAGPAAQAAWPCARALLPPPPPPRSLPSHPPALPPRDTRTRTRPRPAAGAVDAKPFGFAGSSPPSGLLRRGLGPAPPQWHAPDLRVTSRHPPLPTPTVYSPAATGG